MVCCSVATFPHHPTPLTKQSKTVLLVNSLVSLSAREKLVGSRVGELRIISMGQRVDRAWVWGVGVGIWSSTTTGISSRPNTVLGLHQWSPGYCKLQCESLHCWPITLSISFHSTGADAAARFQSKIDAFHRWSVEWKIPFNDTKYHVLAFGKQDYRPLYRLGSAFMEWVSATMYRYFGATCNVLSNL